MGTQQNGRAVAHAAEDAAGMVGFFGYMTVPAAECVVVLTAGGLGNFK